MSSLLDLPNSSAATVSLEVASADEELLLRTRNAPNWKGPLSVDGYVRREAFLGLQDATKDGGLTTWVLVDRKGTKRLILASCETYRKRAYVGRKGYVQEVSCHAVGSVFCPPEMRSRGYATRMMEDLRSRLVTWQIEESPCYFSILFSDIGKTFYTALGWRPYPSFHLHLRTDSLARTQAHITAPTIKLLHTPDLEELCRRDERELKRRLCQISAEDKIAIAVAPDYQTMRWHHAREAFICHELGRELPAIKGALAKYSQGQAWCVWTRVWNSSEKGSGENSLQILRLVAGDDKAKRRSNAEEHGATDISKSMAIAALLQEALHQADQWGLSAVEIWNPNEEIQAASREVSKISKLIERTNHNIPSMKWFGEMAIDSPEAPSESIVWLASEKFGWC